MTTKNDLLERASELILADDLKGFRGTLDQCSDIDALTMAAKLLADTGTIDQLSAVLATVFNLGFLSGREDGKLDVFRE